MTGGQGIEAQHAILAICRERDRARLIQHGKVLTVDGDTHSARRVISARHEHFRLAAQQDGSLSCDEALDIRGGRVIR